ncbi:hypothetical protein KIV40_28420, partial [Vibrio sp. D173a]|uniref:hypothetical protein n=1 Tax=Vibrio sp. D173a TaxID=2836349 RepID=UPI0025547F00
VTPSRLEPLILSYWMTQTGWTLNAEQFEQAKEAIAESVLDVSELVMERGVLWGTPQGISPTTKDVESLPKRISHQPLRC